ncbi:GIY-YIG nuclease family protein [Aeromicrobium alkaliterrae]|uniref:GIY-YIG nuclease family protein n=1 Tax=Aeromicrobium alkaliterrae TaxID=302168 RepID=A0ABP4VFN7_9ACTN
MAAVYILRCADGSYYVGSTRNLGHRLQQHADGGGAVYTRDRLPVVCVWAQETPSVREAYGWERKIHGWSRAKKEALIAGEWELLPPLSRRRGGKPPPEQG